MSSIIVAEANVFLIGTQSIISIGTVLVWSDVIPGQDPNWQDVSEAQSPSWLLINDSQTPNWKNVA